MPATFRASHNHARTTARKARLVIDMIRGLPVNTALRVLDRSPRRGRRAHREGRALGRRRTPSRTSTSTPNQLRVETARVGRGAAAGRLPALAPGRARPRDGRSASAPRTSTSCWPAAPPGRIGRRARRPRRGAGPGPARAARPAKPKAKAKAGAKSGARPGAKRSGGKPKKDGLAMGQKVHPIGFRIGITEPWRSRWYAGKKDFGALLVGDQRIRRFIKKEYHSAAVPRIDIERTRERVTVIIHTARPGLLIGPRGAQVDKLNDELGKLCNKPVAIRTVEISKPELSAQLVAESMAEQLMRRASFRRALKKSAQLTMQAGALGVKMTVAGRLGGAEIARTEKIAMGSVPLNTLSAWVDYGFAQARTPQGVIGIKTWVHRGKFSDFQDDQQQQRGTAS
jgi:small subunit ribosomal protein S3